MKKNCPFPAGVYPVSLIDSDASRPMKIIAQIAIVKSYVYAMCYLCILFFGDIHYRTLFAKYKLAHIVVIIIVNVCQTAAK